MLFTYLGICEPHNSTACAAVNNWDFCNVEEFHCPAMEAEGNVGLMSVTVASKDKRKDLVMICIIVKVIDEHLDASKEMQFPPNFIPRKVLRSIGQHYPTVPV